MYRPGKCCGHFENNYFSKTYFITFLPEGVDLEPWNGMCNYILMTNINDCLYYNVNQNFVGWNSNIFMSYEQIQNFENTFGRIVTAGRERRRK